MVIERRESPQEAYRRSLLERNRRIVAALEGGYTVAEVMALEGLSQRQVYRIWKQMKGEA